MSSSTPPLFPQTQIALDLWFAKIDQLRRTPKWRWAKRLRINAEIDAVEKKWLDYSKEGN